MKRLTCVSPIAAKTAEALVQFHRGQDLLFTTSELLAGVRLVLDEPTARRAVYEWLDLFGYCVTDDWIVEPAGGWQEYGSDDVCATLYGWSPTHDPAAEFLRSSNGAAIADDLEPLTRAMFVRYSVMHHLLVATASPLAARRFEAAGIELLGLPKTAEAREDLLAPIRRMCGLTFVPPV
jgi:hypothetical protein